MEQEKIDELAMWQCMVACGAELIPSNGIYKWHCHIPGTGICGCGHTVYEAVRAFYKDVKKH